MKGKAFATPDIEGGSQRTTPRSCYKNSHGQAVYLLPKKVTSTLKGISGNYGKIERFASNNRLTCKGLMKAKLFILTAIAVLCVATPAFAKHRVVQTRNGRAVVVNTHRQDSRSSRVFWNVGIGFPFFGGYYGGYP